MTPTRVDLEGTSVHGGGNPIDISLELMHDGDGIIGPRAEFSTNAGTNSYHFVGPSLSLSPPQTPQSQSQQFLDFKAQAEKLIVLATKLCPDERQRANTCWHDLGKKLLSQPRSRSTTVSSPTAKVSKPSSPARHGHSQASTTSSSSRSHQAASPTGGLELGPGEELLLQTASSSSSTASCTEPLEDNDRIELPANGPIRIMDDDPPAGEIVLSSSSSNSSVKNESDNIEDPLSTLKCKHCPAVFHDWNAFHNHQPSHKKTYKCDQCDVVCGTKGNLNVHRRIHSGEKPFVCSKCSARFSNSGNLRRHVLTHQGLKPYYCDICDTKFTEKKSLLTHQRGHRGERPFVCTDCGQGFNQPSILNSHRLIHSNEKPFCCLKCGHKFRQKSQLTLHEKRHAGIKNFACSHSGCTAAFVTKADLERHVRSHGGTKIPCEVCGSTFMRKHTLKNHMKSRHP